MITKDYSNKGTIKLAPIINPEEDMIVALENERDLFVIASMVQEKNKVTHVRLKKQSDKSSNAGSLILISSLRQIAVEYEDDSIDSKGKPNRSNYKKQLPLDSEQWNYVLTNNMIGEEVQFDTVTEKIWEGENFSDLKLKRIKAKLLIGKIILTKEELYSIGEMCYNFRIQQEQSKTDISFRQWFNSKFL